MQETKRTLIIDPPYGWHYGFPKPVPKGVMKSETLLRVWLAAQNYPDIELALNHSRYWEQDIGVDDNES